MPGINQKACPQACPTLPASMLLSPCKENNAFHVDYSYQIGLQILTNPTSTSM